MGITIERPGTNRAMWTSPTRLYLDGEGKVVGSDDPAKAQLLVGEGGSIPLERAKELGLVEASEPTVKNTALAEEHAKAAADKAAADEKAKKSATEDKARKPNATK